MYSWRELNSKISEMSEQELLGLMDAELRAPDARPCWCASTNATRWCAAPVSATTCSGSSAPRLASSIVQLDAFDGLGRVLGRP
jgi:hypothetical protein